MEKCNLTYAKTINMMQIFGALHDSQLDLFPIAAEEELEVVRNLRPVFEEGGWEPSERRKKKPNLGLTDRELQKKERISIRSVDKELK